jgi:hypothetical protein
LESVTDVPTMLHWMGSLDAFCNCSMLHPTKPPRPYGNPIGKSTLIVAVISKAYVGTSFIS